MLITRFPSVAQAPSDLLHAAAHLLTLATLSRSTDEHGLATAQLERSAISAAAAGLLDPPDLDVPTAAFGTPARALAWVCAARSCRVLGRRSTPHAARFVLATLPRLDLPLEVWTALLRETEEELDVATIRRAHPRAVSRLRRAARDRVALSQLVPVVDALSQGSPSPSTARVLREVALLFDRHPAPALEAS
jgi:hypothetical protein